MKWFSMNFFFVLVSFSRAVWVTRDLGSMVDVKDE